MKDVLEVIKLLFAVIETEVELSDRGRELMSDAKKKFVRARELLQGREKESGEKKKDSNWKADSPEEKALTKRLFDWFANEPEGEQLNDYEVNVLETCLQNFGKYGSISKKQLGVFTKAWKRITDGKPLPTS